MGHLGSDLNDYWGYQLIDHVREQVEQKKEGNLLALSKSLNKLNEAVIKRIKKKEEK